MVHLKTLSRIEENFRNSYDKIRKSGYSFAVVHSDKIEYYDCRNSLYMAHPYFRPESDVICETSPLLVDIESMPERETPKICAMERLKRILKK